MIEETTKTTISRISSTTKIRKFVEDPATRIDVVNKVSFGEISANQIAENISNLKIVHEKEISDKIRTKFGILKTKLSHLRRFDTYNTAELQKKTKKSKNVYDSSF